MCKDAISSWSQNGATAAWRTCPGWQSELVNSGVDLIVVDGGSTARAVLALTSTIPIVMTSSADPFTTRAVQSLPRPGSNVTGLTSLAAGISGKVIEIFQDLIPGLSNLAILAP